jgi:XisH protein
VIDFMPARDKYHYECRVALEAEGWLITHDPYTLRVEGKRTYPIDLGAEKIIAAEKGNEKIAVEIKSFLEDSLAHAFHEASGQYLAYFLGLSRQDPDRILYLAVPEEEFKELEQIPLVQMVVQHIGIRFIVFNPFFKKIVLWKK